MIGESLVLGPHLGSITTPPRLLGPWIPAGKSKPEPRMRFLASSESRHWRHGRHFADGMPAMERLCVPRLAGPKF